MTTNISLKCTLSKLLTPFAVALAGTISLGGTAAQALTFKFSGADTINSLYRDKVVAGFTSAGNLWSSIFTDNVTVRINIGFQPLIFNTIGETESNNISFRYQDVRKALIADQTSTNDAIAVAHLPSGQSVNFMTTDASGNLVFDADGTTNNLFLDVTRANAKALGLLGDDGLPDASITFSSGLNFDFEPSDGITKGSFDFVGLAVHEIGHALGFDSGVDDVDYNSSLNEPGSPKSLNNSPVFSVLDLYRYSQLSVLAGKILLRESIRDFSVGEPFGFLSSPYFSIDGGEMNLGLFSTGDLNGDGNQASHWKDDKLTGKYLGIMDPTYTSPVLSPSQPRQISNLDKIAFDVIGWNLVPTSNSNAINASGLNLGKTNLAKSDISSGLVSVPEPSILVGLMGLGAKLLLKRSKRKGN